MSIADSCLKSRRGPSTITQIRVRVAKTTTARSAYVSHPCKSVAPRQNNISRRTRLGVESLEPRDVPAVYNWVVDTLNDTDDANLNDFNPRDATNDLSLRAAVQQANFIGGGNTFNITFNPATFGVPQVLWLTKAMDAFQVPINLTGTGINNLAITAGGAEGVFHIKNTSASTITDLTIFDAINNKSVTNNEGTGGGINNRGNLTLTRVKINNCRASEEGGGVFTSGNLNMDYCYITNNATTLPNVGYGGGLGVASIAQVTLLETEISHNTSTSRGGGISIRNTANVLVRSGCLIWDNEATHGAGFYNSAATFRMQGGTIKENRATDDGGGLMQSGGSSILDGTDVLLNTAGKRGGGVYAGAGSVQLRTCTFNNNKAPQGAKVAESVAGLVLVVNCFGLLQNEVVVA
ncbi:MAG: right-handed parallel beta-helix repeat-containing protein [Gemmataceae bacterium]|nr:right-handed parallel beta-helix repeat-containing protein [Gemmataceae bacterium]